MHIHMDRDDYRNYLPRIEPMYKTSGTYVHISICGSVRVFVFVVAVVIPLANTDRHRAAESKLAAALFRHPIPIRNRRGGLSQCPQCSFEAANVVVDEAFLAKVFRASNADQSQHGIDLFEIQYLQE